MARHSARILVVDDHPEMARLLCDQLSDAGHQAEVAHGGEGALERVRERPFDLVITDLRMEKVDGLDVIDGVRAIDPEMPVILMTAFGAIESAIEAIRRGAFHYLTKPFRLDEVLLYVERAVAARRVRDENRALKRQRAPDASTGMVGKSAAMVALHELLGRLAPSPAPVLIRGESGTGKELVARALHERSGRSESPFVAVNCTALPEALLESELFGHVKGAYTGATTARRGLFVEGDGGTLFLDEIGDMPRELQGKLLRVLEDQMVRPVGSDVARKVDVRVVAATHQDLERAVKEGRFRQDLFYRLNVVPVFLPPLRERREDIPLLVAHLFAQAKARNPTAKVETLSPEVIDALSARSWPGNVRELENVVERLVIVGAAATVTKEELARSLPPESGQANGALSFGEQILPLRQLENDYILHVVALCGGNKTKAADLLGIDVSTIHRREKEAKREGP